ncbi:PTS sugar transporter subunit IIB [Fonticella tunisiensis]|uniref:PTS system cellobiose-specific IIB component n=1 Tax=Fonticella tunisiensis TaxID=1096341 RepID=A0A4V3ES08_9CLOT|nr:PTS sugar transporter subunit IIB [Fonticella tunisiensis]TDT51074.1 PTS system cellobiose-specific IIB component [Fonticella tunisiensis]
MITIRLFCSAGMSTSMLINKIEAAAKKKGLEVSVDAFPEAEMPKKLDGVDVVLLGPQVKFALPKAKKLCDERNIPVDVISPVDYGMMNGEKVLDQALRLIKK